MRQVIFLLGTALPALAQFSELATNGEGSQLYFVTNLRQRDTQQSYDPKLFRFADSNLSTLSS